MPWGQFEGANVRQQPKLWDSQRERKKKKERTFPQKSLTWPSHRTKDWANTKGELACCIQAPPRPRQRQRGRWRTARAVRQGAISDPETSILHQTVRRIAVANHVFLGFWRADICQEGHSLRSAPQRRHIAHLRQCSHGTPGKLSGGDQGGD